MSDISAMSSPDRTVPRGTVERELMETRPVSPDAGGNIVESRGETVSAALPDRVEISRLQTRTAVYDVSDVSRKNGTSISSPSDGPRAFARRVVRKVVEIPLAMGKKSLSIYQKSGE